MNYINIGVYANDGTGDKLRNAMIIVNENFVEVHSLLANKSDLNHTHSISEIDGLQNIIDNIGYSIDLVNNALDTKADLDVYDLINAINDSIILINDNLNSQILNIEEVEESISSVISSIQYVQTLVNSVAEVNESQSQNISNINLTISQLNNSISDLEDADNNLTTAIDSLLEEQLEINNTIGDIEGDIDDLIAEQIVQNGFITALQNDVIGQAQNLSDFQTITDTLMTGMQSDLSDINTNVQDIVAEQSVQNNEILNLQSTADTQSLQIQGLQTNVTTLISEIDILQADVASQELENDEQNLAIAEINTAIAIINNNVTDLNGDMIALQDNDEAQDILIANLQNAVSIPDVYVNSGVFNTASNTLFLNRTDGATVSVPFTFPTPASLIASTFIDSYRGTRLTPTNPTYNGFDITRDSNTNVGFSVVNTNTGNSAISGFGVAGTSSAGYGIGVYYFSPNYFVPYLRGNTSLMSLSSDLFILASSGKSIDFVTGTTYGSETSKLKVSGGGTISIGVTPSTDDTVTKGLARKSTGEIVEYTIPTFVAPPVASGLVQVTEGGKTGWRLAEVDPANYDNIGEGAIDLSISTSPSSVGALGTYSFASGFSSTVTGGYSSILGGIYNVNYGQLSSILGGQQNTIDTPTQYNVITGGRQNTIDANYAFVGSGTFNRIFSGNYSSILGGQQNVIFSNHSSILGGIYNSAYGYGEIVGGLYSSPDNTQSRTSWVATDRILTIGNGSSLGTPNNALVILKNGLAELPSVTNALIESASGKAIVTKEYLSTLAAPSLNQVLNVGSTSSININLIDSELRIYDVANTFSTVVNTSVIAIQNNSDFSNATLNVDKLQISGTNSATRMNINSFRISKNNIAKTIATSAHTNANTFYLPDGTQSAYTLMAIGATPSTDNTVTKGLARKASGEIVEYDRTSTSFFTQIFSHGAVSPLDNTTYYIGNFPDLAPNTSNAVTRRIHSQGNGYISSVSVSINVGGTIGSAETSTFEIHNLTQGTSRTITTTAVHNTDTLQLYTLSSVLNVSETDELQIRWTAPNWVTNPTTVRQRFTIKINNL